ncbi:MAG TPA: hypothetical protein VF548_16010 [Allosphingosinicella sp.]|jgi:hypothetical protein
MSPEEMIAIWSKAIDTQMHFNEMATKSRQLGLAFVAAALGVGLVLLGQGEDFSVLVWGGWRLHVTVFVILAAVLALMAVRKLDLGVYHQMLRGAVAFGEDFEEAHMKPLFRLEKGLTQAVSHFSRNSDASAKGPPGNQYTGSNYKTAGQKVAGFYALAIWVLLISAVALFGVTNAASVSVERRNELRAGNQELGQPQPAARIPPRGQVPASPPPLRRPTSDATSEGNAQ